MSKLEAGLSHAQQSDFPWWKEAWDQAMVTEHKAQWGQKFAQWMQEVIDAKKTKPNAFSHFVHSEWIRVLKPGTGHAVPGA